MIMRHNIRITPGVASKLCTGVMPSLSVHAHGYINTLLSTIQQAHSRVPHLEHLWHDILGVVDEFLGHVCVAPLLLCSALCCGV